MAKKTFYNIPVGQLAEKLNIDANLLLQRLLEERQKEGSVLSVCTFLDNRPVSPMPAELAQKIIQEIIRIAEEIRAGLINPLDLLD